tara:strand:+ start:740 stop:1120 length:381 start_codon:yes stop_codon:yes gene_type:complete
MKQRRRAIDAKLIRRSKDNPGYFVYQFKIRELDGSINVMPSYGVDMSDALDRILKNERRVKINEVYVKKIEPTLMIVIFASWVTTIILSSIKTTHPEYAFYGTISLISIAFLYAMFNFIKQNRNLK